MAQDLHIAFLMHRISSIYSVDTPVLGAYISKAKCYLTINRTGRSIEKENACPIQTLMLGLNGLPIGLSNRWDMLGLFLFFRKIRNDYAGRWKVYSREKKADSAITYSLVALR